MKVLQINSVCGIKSTGRICTDIADMLTKAGNECKIACGRESVPEKFRPYAVRIGNNFDVLLHALSTRIFDNTAFASKRTTKKFIKWVKEYDPDIIHLHNLHGYYINIKLLFEYLKDSGKPVVWTLHDCWSFTGHCAYFDLSGCTKWQSACKNCPSKKGYPSSLVFDNSSENFKLKKRLFTNIDNLTLVTPSKWLAELTKQSFLKNQNVIVINNGINTDVFKPTFGSFREKYNLNNKKIVLGVASSWSKSKGLFDFYRLAELLDDEYKIVLVGLTQKQKNSLPSNILGITRTDSTEELAQIYTAADVFVNPTYSDNYPTVNLEALACQTPVVGYKTGGSSESIEMGNGTLVKQGDTEALANAVRRVVLAQKKTDSFTNTENISIETMVSHYMELYKKNQEIKEMSDNDIYGCAFQKR